LQKQYVPDEEKNEKDEKGKVHPIEDATVHFVGKKILEKQTDSLSMFILFLNFKQNKMSLIQKF
jgi:hypothetical protein